MLVAVLAVERFDTMGEILNVLQRFVCLYNNRSPDNLFLFSVQSLFTHCRDTHPKAVPFPVYHERDVRDRNGRSAYIMGYLLDRHWLQYLLAQNVPWWFWMVILVSWTQYRLSYPCRLFDICSSNTRSLRGGSQINTACNLNLSLFNLFLWSDHGAFRLRKEAIREHWVLDPGSTDF